MSNIEIQVVPHIHTMQREEGILNNRRIFEFFKDQLDQNIGNSIVLFLEYRGSRIQRDLIVYTNDFYKRLYLPKTSIRNHTYTSIDDSKEESGGITHIQKNTVAEYNPAFFEFYQTNIEVVVEDFGYLLDLIYYYTQEYRGPTKLKFEKSFEGTTIRWYDVVMMEVQLELLELFERNQFYGDGLVDHDDVVYLLGSRNKLKDFIENFLQAFLNDQTYVPPKEFLDEIIHICSKENRMYILDESREYLTIQYMNERLPKIQMEGNQYYLVFGRLHHFESWNDYLMENDAGFYFKHIVLDDQEEQRFPKHKKIKHPIRRVHTNISNEFTMMN